MSCWRNIASLPSRIITGDLAASSSAHSATAASNSSAGTTWLTIPIRSASSRVDALAQQQQLVGLLARDVAVDQRHDHEGEDADGDLGGAERRALAGDDEVAGQREPSAPASTWPLAAQIVGLPSSPIRRNRRGKRSVAEVLVDERGLGGEPAEVAARGEDLLVGGREHDAADGVVVAGGGEGRDQLVEQLEGQRVASLGVVERDGRDPVGDLVAELLVGHAGANVLPPWRRRASRS